MLDPVSSIAAIASQMSTQKTNRQVGTAVLKIAQDMQEQQGKNALQLIESASSAPASTIDVHV